MIAPVVVQGEARFPGDGLPEAINDSRIGNTLLGCLEIAVAGKITPRGPYAGINFKPAVDDDVGLPVPHHLYQVRSLPFFTAVIVKRVIEPEYIELSVAGEQLLDLGMHVFKVIVPVVFLFGPLGIVAHGVVAHVRIVGMMPVDQGIVQAHLQTFCTKGIEEFAHQIASRHGGSDVVVGVFAVEQTKSVVMLGSHYGVFHAGFFCNPGPFFGIIGFRLERVHVFPVIVCRNALIALHPLPTGRYGINAEMDEHSESCVTPPPGAIHFFSVNTLIFGRRN